MTAGRAAALIWIMMVLGLAAVVVLHDDYGVTWDEGVHSRYGELVLDYYQTGGRDKEANEYLNLKYYGPLVDLAAAAAYEHNPDRKYQIRHLILGLIALLAIPALAAYGRRFRDPWVPVFAVLALIMLPRFVGHAFNNSKDVAFAVAVAWFMVATVKVAVKRDFSWRRFIAVGCTLGLACAIRPGGLILLLLLFLATTSISHLLGESPLPTRRLRGRKVAALGLAWLVMILPWPWGLEHPLVGPLQAMSTSLSFPEIYPVLFEGQVVSSDQLPRHYLAKYLWITTPPSILLLTLLGLARAGWVVIRESRTGEASLLAITACWLLLPVALFVLRGPPSYDGLRHFLFVLPALALLAGYGAAGLTCWTRRYWKRSFAAAPAVVLLLLPIVPLVQLHPYESTYFNGFVGGLSGAAGRYETDYWVASYGEAMGWINEHSRSCREDTVRVLVGGGDFVRDAAAYRAADHVRVLVLSDAAAAPAEGTAADYYLGTTRYRLDRLHPEAPVVHRVGRRGVTFSVVKRLSEGTSHPCLTAQFSPPTAAGVR